MKNLGKLKRRELENLIGTTIKCIKGTKTVSLNQHYTLCGLDGKLLMIINDKGRKVYMKADKFSN